MSNAIHQQAKLLSERAILRLVKEDFELSSYTLSRLGIPYNEEEIQQDSKS